MSSHLSKEPFKNTETSCPEDFLMPEQRVAIIADVLSDIALRLVKEAKDQEI